MNSEFGDFQTPPGLVAAVLNWLKPEGPWWPRVLEPTCGRGRFLAGILEVESPPREFLGIEIQGGHLVAARVVAQHTAVIAGKVRVRLDEANIFETDLRSQALGWRERGPILVVGNPPWVTNAALGAMESGNRPDRSNLKKARGLDAKTGSSNFDIAEAVWIKLLTELADEPATIALLCKSLVARHVLEHARTASLPIARASMVRIDAKAWFGASVDACLLRVTLDPGAPRGAFDRIPVFADFDAKRPEATMGFVRDRLVPDLDAHASFAFADGASAMTWRQGVKHDAASVMELTIDDAGSHRNKRGDRVDIESSHVYPLLKGTDLSRPSPLSAPRRRVIVTQRGMTDDTDAIRHQSPRLWAYLDAHAGIFARRKSSIYRGRSAFAMFGIGPYSFSPYKVAVSGLHKSMIFHAIGPERGRPVMLDDTGYFLPCHSPEQAAIVAALLNGPEAIGLLRSLSFPGSKRPVTKSILHRLDLHALLARADRPALLSKAESEVVRLSGRPADWPRPIDSLLAPEGPPRPNPIAHTVRP